MQNESITDVDTPPGPAVMLGSWLPRRIGRLQVIAELGCGGMGEIFLTELHGPHGFRKRFAVKRLRPALGEDPALIQMFVREAVIVSRLIHPAVCQVHELGEDDDAFFIVMEYLDGVTLAELLRDGAAARQYLPLSIVLQVITRVGEGLHAAHELRDDAGTLLGLVHRDVTPSNVMITRDGRIKLLDFGVAKIDPVRTQAGLLRGKYGYMSPEQISGHPVDRRTDVFALGVVMHELLTGRRLFARGGLIETANAILFEPRPDIRRVRPELPAAVVDVLERALARDREDRFPSAAALVAALRAAAGSAPLASPELLARLASLGMAAVAEEPEVAAPANDEPEDDEPTMQLRCDDEDRRRAPSAELDREPTHPAEEEIVAPSSTAIAVADTHRISRVAPRVALMWWIAAALLVLLAMIPLVFDP